MHIRAGRGERVSGLTEIEGVMVSMIRMDESGEGRSEERLAS